ncbi:DUF4398 domain-containing protein [Pseudomonas sp. zfem005]|uniref:DUF4398 domain-containing protein n=1 Tax=Pseudomonas sp. zfem005 TaxID=3078200 RepID=UPI002927FACA|nr:DUF4398 domain-containing protein [Pseudomonas sp. zfem005]MDU9414394.1 DUF4398 domain-containing protein [Pseudomonas sp. zfem005]
MFPRIPYQRARLGALLAAACTALAACSSLPSPDQQVSMSRDAVSRAVAAEATQYAPLEMKAAQDKLFLMERALGAMKYAEAEKLAQLAEADANLAEQKAIAVRETEALKQARDGIDVLKKEMLEAPSSPTAPTSPAAK